MSFISIEGRKHLEGVASWLEAGAPHVEEKHIDGFDIDTGIENQRNCGTTCCIAGAVVQFADPVEVNPGEAENWGEVRYRAVELLGISSSDASQLFFPEDATDGMVEGSDVTPEFAAKVIRNYLESGVVDWEI